MSEYVTGINSQVLKWARLKAGIDVEEIAFRLKKDPKTVESWEAGESAPTYIQLESLAYKYYKRPIALFFFPEPPEELDPKKSFRTLPEFELENLLSDTLFAIRQGEAMQESLKELHDESNPSDRKISKDIQVKSSDSIFAASDRIREYLGVELAEQISWQNTDNALGNWRSIIEDCGIYVFKRSLKQKDVSGFCLLDDQFPVIYINNSTSKSRQIFTLFHELAHILLSTNGITKSDINYISALSGENKAIELFCNRFASEFLVPSSDFEKILASAQEITDQFICDASDRYLVSREAILRRLYDKGLVDANYYQQKSQEWNDEYEQSRKTSGGSGNYYATQFVYLGENYLKLAFSKYYQGKFGIEQLADYLNVKVKSIPGLEQRMLSR